MKTLFLYIPLLCISILFNACGNRKHEKETDSVALATRENKTRFTDSSYYNEADFAVAAAEAHLMQINAGNLCKTNASLDTVIKFGRALVENHTVIHDQLAGWAKSNKVKLPDALTPDNKQKYDDLSKMKFRNFENKFTDLIIRDQEQLLDNYRKEAERGNDTLLKAWAREKIRTMETDLQTANWIKAELAKPPLKNKS